MNHLTLKKRKSYQRHSIGFLNMQKKLFSIFILLSMIILTQSCAKQTKYPGWYLVPPKNTTKLLYGVGEGFEPEEAKQAALNDVAGRLRTTIGSKFESASEVDLSGASNSVSQKVAAKVEKTTFNNYNVVQLETVRGGTFVTMVSVDAEKLIAEYKSDIVQMKSNMANLLKAGTGIMQQRNNVAKAVNISIDMESKLRIMKSIDDSIDTSEDLTYVTKVRQDLILINSQIKPSVVASNLEVASIINYGLNKLNISSSGENKSNVTIKITDKWVSTSVMGANIARLVMNISVIDSDEKIIATSLAEITGSSATSIEIAKNSAIANMKKDIDKKGIMVFMGVEIMDSVMTTQYNNSFGNSSADLVDISRYGVALDIKYATTDNFTKKKIYDQSFAFLHRDAALKLKNAINYAKLYGYKFKVFDAFRPYEAQIKLWEVVPDPNYVSNPYTGPCTHCRGVAIDLTLIDKNGKELDMGTGFDSFEEKSHHDTKDLTEEQRKNRVILAGIMSMSGFQSIRTEWWHYQLGNINEYPKYKWEDFLGSKV